MRATTRTGRAGARRPSRLPCSARYRHAAGNGHAAGRAVHAAVQLSLSALPLLAQRLRAAASEATRTNALLASPAGYSAACSLAHVSRGPPLSRVLASVSATERQTLARDEDQASAGARSALPSLPYRWQRSSATGAIEIHATR